MKTFTILFFINSVNFECKINIVQAPDKDKALKLFFNQFSTIHPVVYSIIPAINYGPQID